MTADEMAAALAPTLMCEADMIATIKHLTRCDELGIADQGSEVRIPWLAKKTYTPYDVAPQIRCVQLPYSHNQWKVSASRDRIGYALMEAAVAFPYDQDKWTSPHVVIVDRCFPSGALGVWGREIAERWNLASLITATSQRRVPHPGGGNKRVTGTTPIAVTVPCEDGEPVCADLALTEATYGDVLAGADQDQLRFPSMKLWALGIALETMVRSMSFSDSAVLMLLFRPANYRAAFDEKRLVAQSGPNRRMPGCAPLSAQQIGASWTTLT